MAHEQGLLEIEDDGSTSLFRVMTMELRLRRNLNTWDTLISILKLMFQNCQVIR